MFARFKYVALTGLAVMALAAAPAQARDGYRGHDRGDDDAALAIGAGVVGLALGAALASGSRDRDYYYYDDGYYEPRGYYAPRGYYYGAYPRHYSRNRAYRRDWRGYRHDGWGYRGDRGDRHWRY